MSNPKSRLSNAKSHQATQWTLSQADPDGSPAARGENFWAANHDREEDDCPGMSAIVDVSTLDSSYILTRLGDLAGWGEVLLKDVRNEVQEPPQIDRSGQRFLASNVRDPSHTQFEISLASLATAIGN